MKIAVARNDSQTELVMLEAAKFFLFMKQRS